MSSFSLAQFSTDALFVRTLRLISFFPLLTMPVPQLSIPRKLLFGCIVALVVGAVLLGGLELMLRVIDYGYSPHFARRVTLSTGETIWRDNRWCTAPFFSPALVRRPQPFRLPEKKAAGTYRIFVLGSSAAMGDPEPSFSLARMLESMLTAAYPEQHFEVVNAGITAINSHVVRQVAADCAELEPDLFIVYEGHNEVIGPFGPAAVFAPFLRNETVLRLTAWLKGTRTGQLISAASRASAGTKGRPAEWGGMQMFLQQQFTLDDPRLDTVRAHFRSNLLSIAEAAADAGAKTLICTTVSNQRGFAPFLSQHRRGLAPADLSSWEAHVATARAAEREGNLVQANTAYRAALEIDDDYAELVFRVGRLALQAGRPQEAQAFLQRALDLDTLRFRADSSLNKIIRDLRTLRDAPIEVVDLASTLATRSEGGVPGDDLLYEHVHLTLRGTYEAARELFVQISSDLARRRLITGQIAEPMTYDEARIRLGYTAHEQAMIALELVDRFRSPPFTQQADYAFRLQSWQRRAETATALLARSEALPVLRDTYTRALEASPNDWILARNAGAMFVARGSPAEALPLLQRAASWIDDDIDTLVPLGWAHHALGQTAEAQLVFTKVRELEPSFPGLPTQP